MLIIKIKEFLDTVSKERFVSEYLMEIMETVNNKLFWINLRLFSFTISIIYILTEILRELDTDELVFFTTIFYIKISILFLFIMFVILNIRSKVYYNNIRILTDEMVTSFKKIDNVETRAKILNRYFINIKNLSGYGLLEIFYSFRKHHLSDLIRNAG